jgi:hypothetical protein
MDLLLPVSELVQSGAMQGQPAPFEERSSFVE